MELEKAYEIMGVNKDSTRDEIEKRFTYLTRISKANANMENNSDRNLKLDDISQAYNTIISNQLDLIEKEEEKRHPRKPNPIFKLLGLDEKKARNYIYYHKFHYLFGVLGLILLIYLVKTMVFHTEPDVNMAFIGKIFYNNSTTIEKSLETALPQIKGIGIDGAFLSGNANDPQDSTMQQKVMVLFAAANIDVYILDKDIFEKYGNLGAFASLDNVVKTLGVDKSRYQDYVLKPKDADSSNIYGIDISKSKILKDGNVKAKEMIAAIRLNTKKPDKATSIIKELLK